MNEDKIKDLHPSIQPLVREFLARAKASGYPLRITHGYRSIDEQNALYEQGRTKPGSIVTNAKGGQSFHNFGLAVDVYDEVRGYNTDWDELGRIADGVGLEHGDRGYVDLPHFQYRGGLTLEHVQNGERPPILHLTNDDMTELEKQLLEAHEKNLTLLNAAKLDERLTKLENLQSNTPLVKLVKNLQRTKFGTTRLKDWFKDRLINKSN